MSDVAEWQKLLEVKNVGKASPFYNEVMATYSQPAQTTKPTYELSTPSVTQSAGYNPYGAAGPSIGMGGVRNELRAEAMMGTPSLAVYDQKKASAILREAENAMAIIDQVDRAMGKRTTPGVRFASPGDVKAEKAMGKPYAPAFKLSSAKTPIAPTGIQLKALKGLSPKSEAKHTTDREIAARKQMSSFFAEGSHTLSRGFKEHLAAGDWGGVDLIRGGMKGLGSPIYPTVSGRVVGVENNPATTGWMIIIEDAFGNKHSYKHLMGRPKFSVGQIVQPWDILGGMGSSGRSLGKGGGVHLHYEVTSPQGQNINPEPYLYATYLQGSASAYAKATDPIFQAQMLSATVPTPADHRFTGMQTWAGD